MEELSDYIHQYERYFQNVRQHFGGIFIAVYEVLIYIRYTEGADDSAREA